MTAEQEEAMMEDEIEDLLNFTNNLDYDDVVNDIEVKAALSTIKQKVDQMKKAKAEEQKRDELVARQARANEAKAKNIDLLDGENNLDDMRSNRSYRSEGQKSIAESRAEERLEELKYNMERKAKKDFDTSSRLGDQVAIDDYEKIAKNLADKVLQSNTNLKEKHSNKSIRALLEREAIQYLRQEPTVVE